ncbi:uncharacterized protein LOC130699582 [Daphnia carinata]|uniref:uncharacterized protein LOC130699582 n=1 Tax=Daphnia carinata TaxID=120202 RepID=UPI00257D1F5C|nr:uncharacterized protein LOC130699582 [Daphnia carinata]
MADPIRISALGRNGRVGDLYNHFTDGIIPVDVPNEHKWISKTEENPTFEFFYQQPENFKSHLLGINSHLLQNINQGSASNQQLWFADYLNTNSMDGDEEQAQVTLLFRLVRRTETLDLTFLRSKISDYQLRSGEVGASHVIDKVVYGAEVICSMHRALHLKQETKEAAEVSIYLAARTYFDEQIMEAPSAELPPELEKVSITVLSSLEPGKKYEGSFNFLNRYLQDLLKPDTEENQQKWKPIEFRLRNIPAIRIEARLLSERKAKVAFEKERHQVTKKWMLKYICDVSNDPSLKRFPLLEKHVCYFQDLMTHFWKMVEEEYKNCETCLPEEALSRMLLISNCLNKIIEWFAYLQKEVQQIGRLLSGTDFELLYSAEIEARMMKKKNNMAKLFILKVEGKQDSILNDLEKASGRQASNAILPVLTIFSCEKERYESVYAALRKFSDEARLVSEHSPSSSHHIVLDPSTLDDGAIATVDYSYQPPRKVSMDKLRSAPDVQRINLNGTNSSTFAAAPHQKNFNYGRRKELNMTVNDSRRVQVPDRVDEVKKFYCGAGQNYTTHRNAEPHENRRIAEIYADERRSYSTLIKKGSPNVYLLNATEKSNSDKVNWFDICRTGDPIRLPNPKNHKIIILMGATGSGKSTLINGMVNYILGVQWNDPFRFKCVREDESESRNQAHSQTSSVTAYTIHHQEGMAVPYSITIIDTPGYGDTRGVARDKEITAAIHSFLTQQEIPIGEIHAACFVAASGDSRLTATQRYIIDSVLSIFGKDMKSNLRLLVTFADNADPPVVGACLSANFPATSDGIAYSKFNSSVLYCSNVKQGDDEFSFDQLFWDMGHDNFKKFFDMLEGMNGRNLTSTREVIHSRHQLEQSLKDIEEEMEVCLIKIENIEIFQRKMKTCGYNMEATKNFTFEQTVMRRRKFSCPKGYLAYNCQRCNDTCEKLVKKTSSLHQTKRRCEIAACRCPPYDHSVQDMEYRMVPEKVTTTLLDMKAQYQSNYEGKMDAEKMLDVCSDELQIARVKVLTLLEQVAKNVKSLESTALRSNVVSPSDYLSLMRSRVMEEQAPGYMTRLETLDDIQQMLANGTSQPVHSTRARDNRQPTSQSTNSSSYPAAASNYGQEYNIPPPTQYEPVSGDHEESKPKGKLGFFGL